ncbi:hypothetical protein [Streptomyces sp. LUP47B]|uniref:hypothetical protein n=1 Tax=Streptomyces sp. LUP47B TaxID=1890286 RepID=UPI00159F306E|nr:hypothetical protein [Streptomyces sp. LUP47B]
MLALADPPPPQTEPETALIPGLAYSPEWHREQEDMERVWLDAYVRWSLRIKQQSERG